MSNAPLPELLPEDYTIAQLVEWIRIKLGGSVWRLEGMGQDGGRSLITTAIGDGVRAYSRRVPRQFYETVRTSSNVTAYKLKADGIYGVARVDFIFQTLTISPFLGSLVGVSPIMNLEGRDFASFLMWRKTFQRVTGIEPKWLWDETDRMLRIHNPVHNSVAGVMSFCTRSFDQVKLIHKEWLSRYALAVAKEQVGIIRRKYSNQLPGPGGQSLTLDGDKMVDEAKEAIEKLREELFKFQTKVVPIWD